jgi:hypothetical protein
MDNSKTINRLTKYRDAISEMVQELDRTALKLPYPESFTLTDMLQGVADEMGDHIDNLKAGNYDENLAETEGN